MHLDRLLQYRLSFVFIIILILYNQVEASSSSPHYKDQRYKACISNTSCGKSDFKISYPFWGLGVPQYCGHPGFNLSCDGKNLKIKMLSRTYNVIDINYNTSSIRIINEELQLSECPAPGDYHNTTVNFALFKYTSMVKNATLFYDCPELSYLRSAPFSFFCKGRYTNSLSFFVLTDDWENELDKICGIKLYVPVYEGALKDMFGNLSTVWDVLRKGFEVKWVVDQGHCQECYISGGYCGYNMRFGQSTCFCVSGSYPKVCPQPRTKTPSVVSNSISLEAKVGIGIGATGGLLLIIITMFVFVFGKKDYYTQSTLSSQKIGQLSSASFEEKSSYFGAQLFSYKELQQATNNFDPSKELGKGGFGTVYYGKLKDGKEVAIKRLFEKHKKQVSQFMNELEILTCLDHKHLVKLYGCTPRQSPELLLVYEYVPNSTLADHLHGKHAKTKSLPWPIRLRIATEIASALVYLHASDIIHRDVKSKNILLDANYSVKLADFGISRLFPFNVSHISTTPQGSPGYVDPEYHQFYQLTNKSDVYSFGVVLAELLSGQLAVDRSRNRQEINLSNFVVNKIVKRAWNEIIDPNIIIENNIKLREEVICVAELTFRCLQATSEARPSIEEVLDSLKRFQQEENIHEFKNLSRDGIICSECDSVITSSDGSKVVDKTIQTSEYELHEMSIVS